MLAKRSVSRLITYALFAVLVVIGLVLEKGFHEMHVSKLLIFAAVGVWARELPRRSAWLLLVMVGLLWAMIIIPWIAYRNQRLVPIGNGGYRIENK